MAGGIGRLSKNVSPIERARKALTFEEVDQVAVGGGFISNRAAIDCGSFFLSLFGLSWLWSKILGKHR